MRHLQAAVLRWEGQSSAWQTEEMNPETLFKLFKSAVLLLVDDDSYHARRGCASLVLDLYKLSRDMQVRGKFYHATLPAHRVQKHAAVDVYHLVPAPYAVLWLPPP